MTDYSKLVEQAREDQSLIGLGMIDLVGVIRRKEVLLAGLADAVEQLQIERTAFKNLAWERTLEGGKAQAKLERLTDGIREHRDNIMGKHSTLGWLGERGDRALWSLLDVAGDGRKDTCNAYDDWGGWTCSLPKGHDGNHREDTDTYWNIPVVEKEEHDG